MTCINGPSGPLCFTACRLAPTSCAYRPFEPCIGTLRWHFMKHLKLPLVIALKAAYWTPVGLVVLPARDAVRVVRDSFGVIGRHLLGR
jgi:hypothetical protein